MDELWRAMALVLVIEGMLPFLMPQQWRSTMLRMVQMNNRSVRVAGLISMGLGLFALQILKN